MLIQPVYPLKSKKTALACGFFLWLSQSTSIGYAQTNYLGISGVGHTPDARVLPDGELHFTISNHLPYRDFSSTVNMHERLQLSGRITEINNVQAFGPDVKGGYGDYKDKILAAKLVLIKEGNWYPQIGIGADDFLGTRLFQTNYIVAAKKISDLDISLGYGNKRLNGVFSSLRWTIHGGSDTKFNLLYSRNKIINQREPFSAVSGTYEQKLNEQFGFEYSAGWYSISLLANRDKKITGNITTYLNVSKENLVPKIDETELRNQYIEKTSTQATCGLDCLLIELQKLGFYNIEIKNNRYSNELLINLQHSRIVEQNLLINLFGAALRKFNNDNYTRLLLNIFNDKLLIASYNLESIVDSKKYFLQNNRLVGYGGLVQLNDEQIIKENKLVNYRLSTDDVKHSTANIQPLRSEKNFGNVKFNYQPIINFYINDPSRFYHYAIGAGAGLNANLKKFGDVNLSLSKILLTDLNNEVAESTSKLPKVRSDFAKYKMERGVKINNLDWNKLFNIGSQAYIKLNVGIYEEMFSGFGFESTKYWYGNRIATGLNVDRVYQRDFRGLVAHTKYKTNTSQLYLAANLPYEFKVTMRAAQFLAQDRGVRYEVMRRFKSGIEMGAWYTKTNAYDVLSPGGERYFDKGVMLTIPIDTLSTRYNKNVIRIAIAPWTRDIGQSVHYSQELEHMVYDANRKNIKAYD